MTMNVSGPGRIVKTAFEAQCVKLALAEILPVRLVAELVKRTPKYGRIAASIKEIGLVEPLAVSRDRTNPGKYLLLDGHLRLEALKDMGVTEVPCLMSTDDEAFTFFSR